MNLVAAFTVRIKTISDAIKNTLRKRDVCYVVEPADWVIKHEAISISRKLPRFSTSVTITHYGIRNSIVHFSSINTFFKNRGIQFPHSSNKTVVTWYHVVPGDKRIKYVKEVIPHINAWHTASLCAREDLIRIGIPGDKITVIPIGINCDSFSVPTNAEKKNKREQLGIAENRIVVGSFQKDGNGWGKGLEPKLIKGPDVFCEAVERLSKSFDVLVLLTGPARGYVKNRLEKSRIPFVHHYLKKPDDVCRYYHALDLYLVTSRVEGGPKAILESLASGVPLVSTKVGFAPDVLTDTVNGMLCNVNDVEEIVNKAAKLLTDTSLREKIINNGIISVREYDFSRIAPRYVNEIYRQINES